MIFAAPAPQPVFFVGAAPVPDPAPGFCLSGSLRLQLPSPAFVFCFRYF